MDHIVYMQNIRGYYILTRYKAGTINLNQLSVDVSERRIIYNYIIWRKLVRQGGFKLRS